MSAVIKVEIKIKTPDDQKKPKPTSEGTSKPSQESLLLG